MSWPAAMRLVTSLRRRIGRLSERPIQKVNPSVTKVSSATAAIVCVRLCAAAASTVLFILIVVLSVLQFQLLRVRAASR